MSSELLHKKLQDLTSEQVRGWGTSDKREGVWQGPQGELYIEGAY